MQTKRQIINKNKASDLEKEKDWVEYNIFKEAREKQWLAAAITGKWCQSLEIPKPEKINKMEQIVTGEAAEKF